MHGESALADELRGIGMGWIWSVALFVVFVFGGLLTPWEAVQYLLISQGVSEEGFWLLGFVIGYTLPLTVGFGLIALWILTGAGSEVNPWLQLGGATLILWLAGEVSRILGLGLPPGYRLWGGTGPIYLRPLTIVLKAYFNTYGWSLMICALVLGFVVAVQIERWWHGIFASE